MIVNQKQLNPSHHNHIKNRLKSTIEAVEKENNPIKSTLPIVDAIDFFIRVKQLSRIMMLRQESITVLMLLYKFWVYEGCGLNAYEVTTLTGYSDGSYASNSKRLNKMLDEGFVTIVGTGNRNCKLYAPSKEVIAIIEAHLNNSI